MMNRIEMIAKLATELDNRDMLAERRETLCRQAIRKIPNVAIFIVDLEMKVMSLGGAILDGAKNLKSKSYSECIPDDMIDSKDVLMDALMHSMSSGEKISIFHSRVYSTSFTPLIQDDCVSAVMITSILR